MKYKVTIECVDAPSIQFFCEELSIERSEMVPVGDGKGYVKSKTPNAVIRCKGVDYDMS